MNQDVVALNQEKGVPPLDLPPIGPLVRPKLKLNDLIYVMKVSFFSTWVLARIIDITPKADVGEIYFCMNEKCLMFINII